MQVQLGMLRTKEMRSVSADNPASLALVPEVGHALAAWLESNPETQRGVLIGGLAVSLYAKPRYTEDVDMLFLIGRDIPNEVAGFKRTRGHAFEEKKYQVEVEVTTADQINLPMQVAHKVFETAHKIGTLSVVSIDGLIVLKLFGSLAPKRRHKDLGDIQRILDEHPTVSIDGWPIPSVLKAEFNKLKALYSD